MEKKQFKRRIFILSCALVLFIFIYLFEAGILTTLTRYIKREQDEIKAYYTSLYFDTNGNGKTIALENNVGHIVVDNYMELLELESLCKKYNKNIEILIR